MKVTVSLITFNRPKYLRKAISAVLNQTYTEFEFLILDNGSTQETKDIIFQFQDERIRYIRNNTNQRDFYNYGFKNALGEYLLITHDDDIMLPNFLMNTVELMDRFPECVIVSSNANSIGEYDQKIDDNLLKINSILIFEKYQYISYITIAKPGIICPTALMRRNFFITHNLRFDFSVGPAADSYLWIKCNLMDTKIIMTNEILYNYRLHESQDSLINKLQMDADLYKALVSLFKENNLAHIVPIFILRLLINYAKSYQKGLDSRNDFENNVNQLYLLRNGGYENQLLRFNKFIIKKRLTPAIIFLKIQNRIRIFFFHFKYIN